MDTFRNTESHAHRDVTVLINDGEQTYEMMTKAVQVRDGKMHIQNLENFDDFCYNLLCHFINFTHYYFISSHTERILHFLYTSIFAVTNLIFVVCRFTNLLITIIYLFIYLF